MAVLSTLATSTPYHLLVYGWMFGSQFYHSFLGGVVEYNVLPKKEFSRLQQKLFFIYVAACQLSPSLLCLYLSPPPLRETSSALYSLLTPLAAGAINLFFVGPRVAKIIEFRNRQETMDGRSSDGKKLPNVTEGLQRGGEKETQEILVGEQMKSLNKRFGKWHGVSALFNLASIIGTVVYGLEFAEKFSVPK